jgi:hypothetical protein
MWESYGLARKRHSPGQQIPDQFVRAQASGRQHACGKVLLVPAAALDMQEIVGAEIAEAGSVEGSHRRTRVLLMF